MAETIENNLRKIIIDEQPINPRYYEKISELLDALIAQRREDAISYEAYLKEVKKLAENTTRPAATSDYPDSMNTRGKQSLYDNLENNEDLVIRIDAAVRYTKKDNWKGNKFKRNAVESAGKEELDRYDIDVNNVVDLIKNQTEYD